MSQTPPPAATASKSQFRWPPALALVLGCGVALIAFAVSGDNSPRPTSEPEPEPRFRTPLGLPRLDDESIPLRFAEEKGEKDKKEEKKNIPAPELDGGIAWLNTGGPLSIKKDLKGKVVLLDFWTLCCINCIHNLPDLSKLQKKYANELVVIGLHSPKFDNEKDTNSIRKAILRYQIEHPVVNDADHKIWDRYEVDAWPTLFLIDPEGNIFAYGSGEGNYEVLDKAIEKLVDEHKKKKTLDQTPIRLDL